MSALLKYLVTSTLEGRSDYLKESVIGVQVFGRDIGYDTKVDPVVRVNAGRLRQRLVRFYDHHGDPPAVRIEIPKGGYVPEFVPTSPVQLTREAQASPPAEAGPKTAHPSRRTTALAVVVALSLLPLAFVLLRRNPVPPLAALARELTPFTTVAGSVFHPALSPDSRTVAFDWGGPQDDNRDIWLQRVDADTPVRFTTAPEPEFRAAFSPDGGWIAFLRMVEPTAANLVVKPVVGGAERVVRRIVLGRNDRPRLEWSPDGQWLLTAERPEPALPLRLVRLNAASGTPTPLTNPPPGTGGDAEAAISPDGSTIAFRRTLQAGVEDIYLIPSAGGAPRRLTSDNRSVSGVAWRADGRALVVSSRRAGAVRQLWEFPLDGASATRLTPPAVDAGSPVLSRDGRTLIFVHSHEDKNLNALDLAAPDATPRRLISSAAADTDPAVSPNGRYLAFRSLRTGADEIWIAGTDGSNERRLTRLEGPTAGSAKWSPDGSRLIFNARHRSKMRLFIVGRDGGEPEAVTPEGFNATGPVWSPDGTWIYYSSDRAGASDIWRQPATGTDGAAERVTAGTGSAPKLSPDGRTLYYARAQNAPGLFELSLAAALPAEGRRIADVDPRLLGHWAVAISGLYFVDVGPQPPPVLKHFDFKTRRIAVRATLPGRLAAYDGGLAVTADEKTVFYTTLDRAGSNLVLARHQR
ncbi:MAG: hypothetical protein SFV54_02050 [Bryobacteraceae bacterium]|nr:hypothetical protein [Bryobacteraceae bacterium]